MNGNNISLAQIAAGQMVVNTSEPQTICTVVPSSAEVVQVCPPTQSTTIDTSHMSGAGSDYYQGTFVNGTDAPQKIAMGAMQGVAGAYSLIDQDPTGVDFAAFEETDHGAATNNAPSLQAVNLLWRAMGIIASRIEVQTSDATQASNKLTLVNVDNNLEFRRRSIKAPFCDECGNSAQSTIFTRAWNGPIPINARQGIEYVVNAGQTVDFRVDILGQDLAGNYVQFNGACGF